MEAWYQGNREPWVDTVSKDEVPCFAAFPGQLRFSVGLRRRIRVLTLSYGRILRSDFAIASDRRSCCSSGRPSLVSPRAVFSRAICRAFAAVGAHSLSTWHSSTT